MHQEVLYISNKSKNCQKVTAIRYIFQCYGVGNFALGQ